MPTTQPLTSEAVFKSQLIELAKDHKKNCKGKKAKEASYLTDSIGQKLKITDGTAFKVCELCGTEYEASNTPAIDEFLGEVNKCQMCVREMEYCNVENAEY